jgi:hypothetical protein
MRRRRVLCLLIAAFQVAVPGTLSVADALLEREAAAGFNTSHVESLSSHYHPPSHDGDCGLCLAVSSLYTRGAPLVVARPLPAGTEHAAHVATAVAYRDLLSSELPRAPPVS